MAWSRERAIGLLQHVGIGVVLAIFVLECLRLAGLLRWRS